MPLIRIREDRAEEKKKLFSSPSYAKRISSKINLGTQNFLVVIGHTRKINKYFIPSHAFAFLRIFDVNVRLKDPDHYDYNKITIFYMYNPWGTDIPENMLENPKDILNTEEFYLRLNVSSKETKIEKILNDEINDGLFFIEYSDILKYFEGIEVHKTYDSYEIISKKIIFEDLVTNFSIKFSIKRMPESEEFFLFFNLLNNIFLSSQIQLYEIIKIDISPKPFNVTYFLSPNANINMHYKGLKFQKFLSQTDFILSFTLKKLNYDIVDHIFLSFYVPKNSMIINDNDISVSKIIEKCPENCNKNGICKTDGTCECFPKVFKLI